MKAHSRKITQRNPEGGEEYSQPRGRELRGQGLLKQRGCTLVTQSMLR